MKRNEGVGPIFFTSEMKQYSYAILDRYSSCRLILQVAITDEGPSWLLSK